MQALDALYPRLSVGGYLIVDDYRWVISPPSSWHALTAVFVCGQ
jgi:hypothetical protein